MKMCGDKYAKLMHSIGKVIDRMSEIGFTLDGLGRLNRFIFEFKTEEDIADFRRISVYFFMEAVVIRLQCEGSIAEYSYDEINWDSKTIDTLQELINKYHKE